MPKPPSRIRRFVLSRIHPRSLSDLCREQQIPERTLYRLMDGDSRPLVGTLASIASALKCGVEELTSYLPRHRRKVTK